MAGDQEVRAGSSDVQGQAGEGHESHFKSVLNSPCCQEVAELKEALKQDMDHHRQCGALMLSCMVQGLRVRFHHVSKNNVPASVSRPTALRSLHDVSSAVRVDPCGRKCPVCKAPRKP